MMHLINTKGTPTLDAPSAHDVLVAYLLSALRQVNDAVNHSVDEGGEPKIDLTLLRSAIREAEYHQRGKQ